MLKKAYITRDQTVTFTCPLCQISKTADASRYVKLDKHIKINVKCPCGHTFTSFLERRNNYRKETKLTGSFVRFVAGKPAGSGHIIVRDLSLTGIKLEAFENFNFSKGDVLKIEFRLDDAKKALITKKAVIRNVESSYIGAEFIKTQAEDKALGFYLMP